MLSDSNQFDPDEYERRFFQQHVPAAVETLKRILYEPHCEMEVRLEAGHVLATYGMAEALADDRVPESVRTFLMRFVPTRH
jgi:hypothetical protein